MSVLLGMSGSVSEDEALDVMDVFSTYCYIGNGVNNRKLETNLDMTKGGLSWFKNRGTGGSHLLFDSERGPTKYLNSNTTNPESTSSVFLDSFSIDGIILADNSPLNSSGQTYVSWHFRKSKRFFDIVTYTGNGVRSVLNHNLGIAPGMLIIMPLNGTTPKYVFHKDRNNAYHVLNSTTSEASLGVNGYYSLVNGQTPYWQYITGATPTPIENGRGYDLKNTVVLEDMTAFSSINANGINYVAYFFANDTSVDSCISCGSYTGNTLKLIDVGFEPQFLLVKNISGGNWEIYDTQRGIQDEVPVPILYPNTSDPETTRVDISLNPDGFDDRRSGSFIYLAIRHTNIAPTKPSKVITHQYASGTNIAGLIDSKFSPDVFLSYTATNSYGTLLVDKKAASKRTVSTINTTARYNFNNLFFDNGSGIRLNNASYFNESGSSYTRHYLKRSKKFFESVLYIGTGEFRATPHRLGVAPELAIFKCLDANYGWGVYCSHISIPESALHPFNSVLYINTTAPAVGTDFTWWADSSGYKQPDANNMFVGSSGIVNQGGLKYLSMYFSSCPGISKVGSYTGNGTSINLNFTFKPSLLIIKCITASGNWYVWEGIRQSGQNHSIHALNLPNSTMYVTDTFDNSINPNIMTISQSAITNLNVNNAKYIYLAIV